MELKALTKTIYPNCSDLIRIDLGGSDFVCAHKTLRYSINLANKGPALCKEENGVEKILSRGLTRHRRRGVLDHVLNTLNNIKINLKT